MSLLMLKTKNLSWQDHTLNIEVMLAPLRSTLLLNKHKTLDTKFDQEKALYDRQREACVKDFVVEKRMIERRKQKLLKRKKELMEARSKSALDDAKDTLPPATATGKERSTSAPTDSRGRAIQHRDDSSSGDSALPVPTPGLPKLTLRHTPLFGPTNFLRPRIFLETANGGPPQQLLSDNDGSSKDARSKRGSFSSSVNLFTTEGDRKSARKPPAIPGGRRGTPKSRSKSPSSKVREKSPKPPPVEDNSRNIPRKASNVKFLEFLSNDDESDIQTNIVVEVKEKTVEEKVRDFLKELEDFNSRPPTACSSGIYDDTFLTTRSRDTDRRGPLVANKYTTFTMDKKLLEKAFDKYVEKKSHEDLLKAMKLAAKMKAHIRQARNTSLVPTMATFKSSKSFMRLLKRQQRKGHQLQGQTN